jgi:hypothetical protein
MHRSTLRELLAAVRRRHGVELDSDLRQIPRTSLRILAGADHLPQSGRRTGRKATRAGRIRSKGNVDTFPGYWPGTSVEHDRPARRRRNRQSWRAELVAVRRQAVAAG